MEKALFVFVVAAAVAVAVMAAGAAAAAHRHHPRSLENSDCVLYKKEKCTEDNNQLRSELMEKSQCGEPKEVFETLIPQISQEQVIPGAVWVKKCVGLCDHEGPCSRCVATKTRIQRIPVRIYNAKTNKETCSSYPVEVHEECGCSAPPRAECAPPQQYNPRKCTCQCPNPEEKRSCRRKQNQNVKWNRLKCTCEERRTSARKFLSRL